MHVFRPISQRDFEAYYDLALTASYGLTSLPKDRKAIQDRIEVSLTSFNTYTDEPHHGSYIFVLENEETKELAGTSAVFSRTGGKQPLWFYLVDYEDTQPTRLPLTKQMQVLHPISYQQGPTEIGALYLSKERRKKGLGRLLSLSRFLFIAAHRYRFEDTVFAEMRGVVHPDGRCPFFDAVSRHFIDMEFPELLIQLANDRSFVPAVIPKYPIYTAFLAPDVQKILGKTHPSTAPAINLLAREGFEFTKEIDIFDAGPKIEVKTDEIRTIKESKLATVAKIDDASEVQNENYIIANTHLEFKSCLGAISQIGESEVMIHQTVADALEVEIGSQILYIKTVQNEYFH